MNSFSTTFKAFAVFALVSALNINAMEAPLVTQTPAPAAAAATEAIAPVVTTPAVPTTPATEAKKECAFKGSICKAWTNVSNAVSSKKNEIVAAAKEMKARGWTKWTNKEKATVVIGGTVVAATAAYLVYKVYKSFTAPKTKVQRSPRA